MKTRKNTHTSTGKQKGFAFPARASLHIRFKDFCFSMEMKRIHTVSCAVENEKNTHTPCSWLAVTRINFIIAFYSEYEVLNLRASHSLIKEKGKNAMRLALLLLLLLLLQLEKQRNEKNNNLKLSLLPDNRQTNYYTNVYTKQRHITKWVIISLRTRQFNG